MTVSPSPLAGRKIVFVFRSLDLGGAERQGFLLARHLAEWGAQVQVVALHGEPGRLAELCAEAGIPWRALRMWEFLSRWQWLRGLIRFASLMRKEAPDLLVSYTSSANVLCGCVWRLTGARGAVWNQADEGLGMGREPINRLAVALTSRFISNSTGGEAFLQRCYRVTAGRMEVIHNGIALAQPVAGRAEWRERLGLREGECAACMVANISRFKDHDTLLRAWRELLDQLPDTSPSPVLLLAGRFDGPERELLALAGKLGLGDRVRLLGAVSDVTGLLGAVDLFVYSSRSEGLPNAVVEAMAAGLPVAGTDIPGIREAVGEEGFRYLAPVGDAGALAKVLLQLVTAPELASAYGRALQRRAAESFSLPSMLEQSERCFSDILSPRPGPDHAH